ncbi:helix-turn-helix domain-containing protein, partial [Roseateles sp. GG27B]
ARGNLSEAARLLGLTRPQMAYRQKQRQNQSGPASINETHRKPGTL